MSASSARSASRTASAASRSDGSEAVARIQARPASAWTLSAPERERLGELRRRLRRPPADRQQLPEVGVRLDVVGPQRHGAPVVLERRVRLAGELQQRAEVVVRLRVVGIDPQRLLELRRSPRRAGRAPTARSRGCSASAPTRGFSRSDSRYSAIASSSCPASRYRLATASWRSGFVRIALQQLRVRREIFGVRLPPEVRGQDRARRRRRAGSPGSRGRPSRPTCSAPRRRARAADADCAGCRRSCRRCSASRSSCPSAARTAWRSDRRPASGNPSRRSRSASACVPSGSVAVASIRRARLCACGWTASTSTSTGSR